jgi:hypothetical protein
VSEEIKKTKRGRPFKKRGRPTKYTEEMAEKIFSAIRMGCYAETAAQLNGISKDTFYEWMKKVTNFADAVNQSMSQAEARDIHVIDKAAQNGDWKASAWRLERKHRTRWGQKMDIDVDQNVNISYDSFILNRIKKDEPT